MGILLVFIDGLGLGRNDPAVNPCAAGNFSHLSRFTDSNPPSSGQGLLVPTDATLGVSGLPQSATGQATLLTGINCPAALGYHLQGFPNQMLRDIIREHGILKKVLEAGKKPAFINAFRPLYFKLPDKLQWRLSATTVVNKAAGLPFFTIDHVNRMEAVYHDLTNETMIEKGFDIRRFTLEEAASILDSTLDRFDFVLYEYFLTDMAGHSKQMERALSEVEKLDTLLHHLTGMMELKKHMLIVTSDHGNIEDISVKTHTTNPVMTLLWGYGSEEAAGKIRTLADIAPVLLGILTGK